MTPNARHAMQVVSQQNLFFFPGLSGQVAIEALQHYPVLRRLEITGSRLEDVESFLRDLFKATHQF